MKILVVCGAGASSTFVARRLRQAAMGAGHDWEISAGTEGSAGFAHADLVLIGPHLAANAAAIGAMTPGLVAVLPGDIFTDRDGSRTLAMVEATLATRPHHDVRPHPSPAKGTP